MSRLLTSLAVLAALLLPPSLVAQEPEQRGFLTLKVPADAKVEINGRATTRTGEVRKFASPPLAKSSDTGYYYSIKVTYKGADGKDVIVEKRAQVFPASTTEVDLTPPTRALAEAKNVSNYPAPTRQGEAKDTGRYSAPKIYGGSGGYYDRYYDPSYHPPVGEHWVNSYSRSDGTYVRGHWQTNPDDSFYNNWSTKGNVNPHTGKAGTKTAPSSSRYSRQR